MQIPPVQIGPYRFAPAFWPSVVFGLVFPMLLGLGVWQTQRAGDKQMLLEQRASGELEAPLSLLPGHRLSMNDRYRPAVVRGHYLPEQQWLLDNRIFQGRPGYHVFSQFQIEGDDQPALLINRGWVAVGQSREFLPALPLPEGSVTLRGHLDTPASVGMVIGEVPLDSIADRVLVQALDIPALSARRGLALEPLALVIDDGQIGGLQYDWSPIPPMGPEKHLGYAVQWFGLAMALLIIYVGVNTSRKDGGGGTHVNA